jgi:hypothetical protein
VKKFQPENCFVQHLLVEERKTRIRHLAANK